MSDHNFYVIPNQYEFVFDPTTILRCTIISKDYLEKIKISKLKSEFELASNIDMLWYIDYLRSLIFDYSNYENWKRNNLLDNDVDKQ